MSTFLRFISLFVLLLGSSWALAAESIRFDFCYEDRELLPYYRGNGSEIPEENPGKTIEAVRKLDERVDEVNIHYQRAPWKRCLALLEKGVVSGVIASYKAQREEIGVYPKKNNRDDLKRAFSLTGYCLFVRQDSNLSWNGKAFIGDLRSNLAVPRGYSITSMLTQHKISFDEVDSTDQALFLLHNQRVSGVVTLCDSGQQALSNNPQYAEINTIAPPLVVKGGYLLVSKHFYQAHQKIVEKMWLKLVQVRIDMNL
ncbi:hypothetical protein [Motiliproteus sp. MSK22-1]|uniref:hypothetical protein n=1 Tax=Motiliproteus sp. MSK22-1 TaxID=1897630 RepID=UPI000976C316|nr:hypothetical protein [Motiliproteus sp. MSK22-1]OMH39104.1 hypothetical protein BGP75_05210 [Motiliproteus sp. MSK22-1]